MSLKCSCMKPTVSGISGDARNAISLLIRPKWNSISKRTMCLSLANTVSNSSKSRIYRTMRMAVHWNQNHLRLVSFVIFWLMLVNMSSISICVRIELVIVSFVKNPLLSENSIYIRSSVSRTRWKKENRWGRKSKGNSRWNNRSDRKMIAEVIETKGWKDLLPVKLIIRISGSIETSHQAISIETSHQAILVETSHQAILVETNRIYNKEEEYLITRIEGCLITRLLGTVNSRDKMKASLEKYLIRVKVWCLKMMKRFKRLFRKVWEITKINKGMIWAVSNDKNLDSILINHWTIKMKIFRKLFKNQCKGISITSKVKMMTISRLSKKVWNQLDRRSIQTRKEQY